MDDLICAITALDCDVSAKKPSYFMQKLAPHLRASDVAMSHAIEFEADLYGLCVPAPP